VPVPLLAAQEAVDLPDETLQRSLGLSLAGGQILMGLDQALMRLDQVDTSVGYFL
jgi:heme oxygenase